ncbi:testis expressed 13B [Cricetulus griseus]
MNPEDPTSGFRHGKVLMFINEQMSKDTKGPAFYLENLSLSWEEVEEKLRILLENGEMPGQAQEACAWASLALGVRFAWRQVHLQGRRVQWLHDFACLHRSAAHALASDLKKLTDQQEMERKEAAFQLQLAHTKLAEVQRERDLMRLKLLHAWTEPRTGLNRTLYCSKVSQPLIRQSVCQSSYGYPIQQLLTPLLPEAPGPQVPEA